MKLTERETQVGELLCRGLYDLEIARRIGVSHSTVRKHLSSLAEKLSTNGRVGLALAYDRRHRRKTKVATLTTSPRVGKSRQ